MTNLNPERIDERESLLLKLGLIFLLLNGLALTVSPLIRTGEFSLTAIHWAHLTFLPVWVLVAWLVHRSLKRIKPIRDPYILPLSLTLTGWGLIAIWRVSPEFGARQSGWFLVASVVLLELIRSPTDLRWIRRYRYLWLTAGLFLTFMTLILGTNPTGGGPKLWLGCCGLYFQPSEPLRLLLIAYVASFLSERMALGWDGKASRWLPTLGPLFLIWGLSVLLLFVQRDLGTGTLFIALFAVLLFIASGRWDWLIAAISLGIAGALMSYSIFDVVQVRIQTWLNPWTDPTNTGYQIVQALISYASGGVLGAGPGQGVPSVVPIVHSDFVFSAIVEEWGLLGGLGMIALFAVLIGRAIQSAASSSTRFGLILAAGIAVGFGLQSILILGGVMRLLPLTGVTLPFVSYGGSSLLTSFIAVGLLLKLSGGREEHPQFKPALLRVQLAMTLAWSGLAVVLGWWGLVRAPVLVARTDNPRRVFSQQYSKRGTILDRDLEIIAQTIGDFGEYQRHYPWAQTFASLGYDSLRYGQSGVEASMDTTLRGSTTTNDLDSIVFNLLYGYPESGLDVRVTLDAELQKISEEILSDTRGGMIVLHAIQGDVLGMLSFPAFDPNKIDETWDTLITREDAPLLNRVTQGVYQPGSILAPILVWGIDQEEPTKVDADYSLTTEVQLSDKFVLGCLSNPGEEVYGTLLTGLRLVCPAPFAVLAETQGEEWLITVLERAGLLDVPTLRLGEQIRFEPMDPDIRDLRLESVGQGDLQVSPIQIATAYAGMLYGSRPPVHLVSAYHDEEDRWRLLSPLSGPAPIGEISLDDDIWVEAGLIHDGIWAFAAEAISDQDGTKTGWYVAALRYKSMPIVLVILLEDTDVWETQNIGEQLVNWMVEESYE